MRRLDINIEEIRINGRPEILSQPVKDMDEAMQKLADATEHIKGIIYRYSGTNQGRQYERASIAAKRLSDFLYEASETLNDVQCQIVNYENQCHMYEDEPSNAVRPRPHGVMRIRVQVNTNPVEFHREEMENVARSLQEYSDVAMNQCKILKRKRDEIGDVWCDPQYRIYSIFIDDVCGSVSIGCRNLDEYRIYLIQRINALN